MRDSTERVDHVGGSPIETEEIGYYVIDRRDKEIIFVPLSEVWTLNKEALHKAVNPNREHAGGLIK